MAKLSQAISATLDLGVVAPIAIATVTKEVAGTAVDSIKSARKALSVVDDSISIGKEYIGKELALIQVKNELELKQIKEMFKDEDFKAQYNERFKAQLLKDLFDEEEEISL